MAGPSDEDAMPRAKRLKLLREAKLRKERGESRAEASSAAAVAAPAKVAQDEPMEAAPESDEHQDGADAAMTSTNEDAAPGTEADGLVEKIAQAEEDEKTEDEDEEDLLNLAPKRANWDMERDIAPMLRKLEKRTQHAIVEILREKLAAEQQEEDEDEDDDEEEEEEDEDEE